MTNKDMNMWHKRILFMISLPSEDYEENKELISDCISRLRDRGVDIRESIRHEDLASINNYDVVIIVTHFDKDNEILVLKDDKMPISNFINSLPEDYSGYLDLSFCHSKSVESAIKKRCPYCIPQVSKKETRLKVRLVVYPFVIDHIYNNDGIDYKDAYKEVLDMLEEAAIRNPENDGYEDDSLRLGIRKKKLFGQLISYIKGENTKNNALYIYSPSKVIREKSFSVQIYIERDNAEENVTKRAKSMDSNTQYKGSFQLKLKKGDKITVQYSAFPTSEHIIVDEPIQSMEWDGDSCEFCFNVIIGKLFDKSSFNGTLLISINNKPKIKNSIDTIVGIEENENPSIVNSHPYNRNKEREIVQEKILKRLSSCLKDKQAQLGTEKNEEKIKKITSDINIYNKVIEVIQNPDKRTYKRIKKTVFVSSTCENFMKPYREAVREIIISQGLNADLCEDWSHGANPSNKCCLHVMDSDIYFCILGGRYGYIEPSLGISMTQMELEVARTLDKEIGIFVLNPPNKSDEAEEIKTKQEEFRNSLLASENLGIFSSLEELKKCSKTQLQTIISTKIPD